ncbi:MAG: rhomboid family intramembrane serine protease, partial [Bacteroidia bacterium]|nr:rhomboid family intramembrane serine protease [Bacteroidia bacterium]
FLHVNWPHFILNMVSLYGFGIFLIEVLGPVYFILTYLLSLIGGSLLSLLVHRQHGDYSAAGASGAISGIVLAVIAIFPQMEIQLFFAPFGIPGWVYALFYIGISIYGIRAARGNIGHDAHLGGALTGIIVACIFYPEALTTNYLTIALITLPIIVFIFLLLKNANLLVLPRKSQAKVIYMDIDDKYNEERANRQKELDRLLDKIGQYGIDSLSEKEKQKLKELSK